MTNKYWFLEPDLIYALQIQQQKNNTYVVLSQTEDRRRKANQEELLRQLFIQFLLLRYQLKTEQIVEEYTVTMGRMKKRADIVIFKSDAVPFIICEIKIDFTPDSIEQMNSYIYASGASYGILVTANDIRTFARQGGQIIEIEELPLNFLDTNSSKIAESSEKLASQINTNDILNFELIPIGHSQFKISIMERVLTVSESVLLNQRRFHLFLAKNGIELQKLNVKDWESLIIKKIATAANISNNNSLQNDSVDINIYLDWFNDEARRRAESDPIRYWRIISENRITPTEANDILKEGLNRFQIPLRTQQRMLKSAGRAGKTSGLRWYNIKK